MDAVGGIMVTKVPARFNFTRSAHSQIILNVQTYRRFEATLFLLSVHASAHRKRRA